MGEVVPFDGYAVVLRLSVVFAVIAAGLTARKARADTLRQKPLGWCKEAGCSKSDTARVTLAAEWVGQMKVLVYRRAESPVGSGVVGQTTWLWQRPPNNSMHANVRRETARRITLRGGRE